MRILCLLKIVPDVENLRYDQERKVLIRDSGYLLINPEDATAVAIALNIKRDSPDVFIEIVSMAPQGAVPYLEDLLRRGVDRVTLISDPLFVGSDTYATSRILARYMGRQKYDCIFSGTHSMDGGTGHIPAQVAEILGISQLSGILGIETKDFHNGSVIVDIEDEQALLRFSIKLPTLLGFEYAPKHKLPYIAFKDINRDVKDLISIVTNQDLKFKSSEVGLEGSLTKVKKVEVISMDKINSIYVSVDDFGIETVYKYLKEKGFLKP